MKTRQEALAYGLSFPDTYQDAPFHDENWQLVRVRKNKKVFLWTYERDGKICINVKVSPPVERIVEEHLSIGIAWLSSK